MRLAPLLLYLFDLANLIIPKIRCYFYVKAPIKCIFYQINQASARIILVGKLSYEFKVAGYYLYFTSHCVIECMHVHASDRKLTEAGSAKFFVENTGETVLKNRGILTDKEIRIIQRFIKQNYQEMYLKWAEYSSEGFYNEFK